MNNNSILRSVAGPQNTFANERNRLANSSGPSPEGVDTPKRSEAILELRLPGIVRWRKWTQDEIFVAVCKAVWICHVELRGIIAREKAPDEQVVEIFEVLQIAERVITGGIKAEGAVLTGFGLVDGAAFNHETIRETFLFAVFKHRELLEGLVHKEDEERAFIVSQALAITEQWVAREGLDTEFTHSDEGDSIYEKLTLKHQARQFRKMVQWQHADDVALSKGRKVKGGAR